MKILFYNIAYQTGLNGSWTQYMLKLWRFFLLSFKSGPSIIKLLKKANPDVICLAEVDTGSLRSLFKCQVNNIRDKLELTHSYSTSKYGPKSMWNHVPIIRKQYDAIISKKGGDMRLHYLDSGMKKLVQEFIVDNISILTVHLSVLRHQIREKQLRELALILKACPRAHILCGDFNIWKGLDEVQSFIKETGLKLVQTPPTFPSFRPKKQLDLFFASPTLNIKDSGVLPDLFSDHLPVWIQLAPEPVKT